jgi:uncharacterized membrane protein YfcA
LEQTITCLCMMCTVFVQVIWDSAKLPTLLIAAIAGAYFGKRLLKKVTLRSIQLIVAVMLILISLALGFGLV